MNKGEKVTSESKHILTLRRIVRHIFLVFLICCIGCDEDMIQPVQYPRNLVGKTYLKVNSRRTTITHYEFSSESEVLEVYQSSHLDKCEFTVDFSRLTYATYAYNPTSGRIDIFRKEDSEEDTYSFHVTELDNAESLPSLAIRDIYVYTPDWGDSLFNFLQVYDCHSGPGTIRLGTEVSIYFSSSYNYDCDVPALLNKCSGGPSYFSLDRIFSDSLHLEVNNAYELLEVAKEEYEQ